MKNYKKGIAPVIIALIVAVVLGGGYVAVSQYSKNKSEKVESQAKEKVKPISKSEKMVNNEFAVVASQDPSNFLTQIKKDLSLYSEIKNTNPSFNAYTIFINSITERSKVIIYLDDKFIKLREKDGATLFANGYMQCNVGTEAMTCFSYLMESGAMRPTFTQEQVLKTKNPDQIERGDVIVFTQTTSQLGKITSTKRVVGLPGETLKIMNGIIYISNIALKKVGPITVVKPTTASQSEIKLTAGQYYVLGDFTEQSYDSRSFGSINSFDILAEVVQ